MSNLKGFVFNNKKVLLRCDFNVPLSIKGEVLDDFRIKKSLATISFLIRKKAKVILISHLSGPEKGKKYSLKLIVSSLEKLLNQEVRFATDCIGKKAENEVKKMKPGEVLLLENLRFYEEEEFGNLDFARKLAGLADIYINEAFSVSHRPHASITEIPKFLPSSIGFLFEKEIKVLSEIVEKPRRPLVAIIGGSKIGTKIKLIEYFLDKADHLLLGSKPAESILIVKGILIGRPLSIEEETLEKINRIVLTHPKLHLPVDGQMALPSLEEDYFRIGSIGSLRKEEEVFDIGPETRDIFVEIIKSAKMIIWNGPLGMCEKEPFDQGTKDVAEAIIQNKDAFKVVGGGDTISVISKLGLEDQFDHVSTGGGAMLEFLSGRELPGIKALKSFKQK